VEANSDAGGVRNGTALALSGAIWFASLNAERAKLKVINASVYGIALE
jgi:hypothetical protein